MIDELSLGDLMELDEILDEDAEDNVEETTTEDGSHIRKEVHQGPGFKSVRITSDGAGGPAPDIPADIGDLMSAMLGGGPSGPSGFLS